MRFWPKKQPPTAEAALPAEAPPITAEGEALPPQPQTADAAPLQAGEAPGVEQGPAEKQMAEPPAPEGASGGEDAPTEEELRRAERQKRRRRATLKRVVPAVVVLVLYVVIAFFMFQNALLVGEGPALLSLRYNTPIAASQVSQAKYTLGNPDVKAEFLPAFWHDSPEETVKGEHGDVKTPVLFVDGDMHLVLPVDFLAGTYPAALESRGLALSQELAWELFGGMNVVGASLEWMGETYTVRGIFEGGEKLMLAQVDAAEAPIEGFSGIELAGETEDDPRDAATAFLRQAGLPTPSRVLSGSTLPTLIWMMAWLPAVVLGLWFVVRLLMLLRHGNYWLRNILWLALLLLLAFQIPRLLGMLPGWVIPTQWSDFSHWSAIGKELNARVTDLLAVRPYQQDVQLRKQLILQTVLLVPALFTMAGCIRRWAEHMRRADVAMTLAASVPDAEVLLLEAEGHKAPEKGLPEAEEHDDIQLLKSQNQKPKNPMS